MIDAWDRDAHAIHAARAHAQALDQLRALDAEPVRVVVLRGRIGIPDSARTARVKAILDAAAIKGADPAAMLREWNADLAVTP